MSDRKAVMTRLIARIRAMLPEDWFGQAGKRLRDTSQAISDFAEEHRVRPKDLLEDGVESGRKKLEGLANKEYAEAAKNFAEAEQKKIEVELLRRSLASKVRKEEAEARLAEAQALDAEVELFKKLAQIGVVLHRDEKGNLTALPVLEHDCDLTRLAAQRLAIRRSPGGQVEVQVVSGEAGTQELWIVSLVNQTATQVAELKPGEGVRPNFIWSPDGHLLAFEKYNLEGHSPMTTTSVSVVAANGIGLRSVVLAPPNERFSTHIERWVDDDRLRVRTTLLEPERVVFYTFSYLSLIHI